MRRRSGRRRFGRGRGGGGLAAGLAGCLEGCLAAAAFCVAGGVGGTAWLSAGAAMAAGATPAAVPSILRVVDPRGDDHGAGRLVYPRRDDLRPGDLDLVEWSARPAGNDVEFEAVFARPIASPAGRVADRSGASLESVARSGFYTLNLDLYIDQDRVPASGDTTMLPGRGAVVDPDWAWEKAICLTPRPLDARRKLRGWLLQAAREERRRAEGRIGQAEEGALAREVEDLFESRYFFPRRVRVLGRSIRFRVPQAFLGGPARREWGYTVVVTGAEPRDRVDLDALVGIGRGGEEGLFVIPVGEVASAEAFGGASPGDTLCPAIVDLLNPLPGAQEAMLGGAPGSPRAVRIVGVLAK